MRALNVFVKLKAIRMKDLTSWCFMLCGAPSAAFGTYLAIVERDATSAGVCLTAGLVFLVAANLDRLAGLKVWGVEAQLQKMDATIDKAAVTIDQLRTMSELAGIQLMKAGVQMGRSGSAMSIEDSHKLKRSIIAMLKSTDCSSDSERQVERLWINMVVFDLMLVLQRRLVVVLLRSAWRPHGAIQDGESSEGQDISDRSHAVRDECKRWRQTIERKPWLVQEGQPSAAAQVLGDAIAYASGIHPDVHSAVSNLLAPWQSRLHHLQETSELSDPEAWYAIDTDRPLRLPELPSGDTGRSTVRFARGAP